MYICTVYTLHSCPKPNETNGRHTFYVSLTYANIFVYCNNYKCSIQIIDINNKHTVTRATNLPVVQKYSFYYCSIYVLHSMFTLQYEHEVC